MCHKLILSLLDNQQVAFLVYSNQDIHGFAFTESFKSDLSLFTPDFQKLDTPTVYVQIRTVLGLRAF